MGVSLDGRCAAITNYRDPRLTQPDRASRGQIPVRFLAGTDSAATFLEALRRSDTAYNPFNLLLFDGRELLGYESHHDRPRAFIPGIHAISNGDFDSPWPKVEALKAGFAAAQHDDSALLALLEDARPSPDERLPGTGISIELERVLSPAFIRTPTYGTRASTIVRLGPGDASILEQRFTFEGPEARIEFRFVRD
jgi:uncharacterized protein with NRDE domain